MDKKNAQYKYLESSIDYKKKFKVEELSILIKENKEKLDLVNLIN
jgi:hypothetical protein